MALHIRMSSEYGVQASYWRIVEIKDNFSECQMVVELSGYFNHHARKLKCTPLMKATLTFDGEDYRADLKRSDLYTIMKNKAEFASALDC